MSGGRRALQDLLVDFAEELTVGTSELRWVGEQEGGRGPGPDFGSGRWGTEPVHGEREERAAR